MLKYAKKKPTLFHRVIEFWPCHDNIFCRIGTYGQVFGMAICAHYATHLLWGMDAFLNKWKRYITSLYRANVMPATTVATVVPITTVSATIAHYPHYLQCRPQFGTSPCGPDGSLLTQTEEPWCFAFIQNVTSIKSSLDKNFKNEELFPHKHIEYVHP